MFWRYFVILADVSYASLEMPGAGFEYFLVPLGLIPFILSNHTPTQLFLLTTAITFFFLRLYISEHHYTPHDTINPKVASATYAIVLFMVFVLCALFVIKFKTASSKYEGIIERQLVEIRQQKKDILDSIIYAKRIQGAMLPPPDEMHRTMSEYFVFYKPKDIVSGDFYWLETHHNKIYVAVADCTGHGVPGALLSVMCTNALARAVKELNVTMPSLILDKVNELLEEHFKVTKGEVTDGMDINLCCIDLASGLLQYSGAYNPLYKISGSALQEIKADKQPIGKFHNRKPFTNHDIKLVKGDCYYLFSDGLSDQFGGPNGKKFTYKQFQALLVSNHAKPMNEQKDVLKNTFDTWKGKLTQIDDVCVLGFRVQ
jgi:serine phosphatase RsbU (regulator of sigma subunit)